MSALKFFGGLIVLMILFRSPAFVFATYLLYWVYCLSSGTRPFWEDSGDDSSR